MRSTVAHALYGIAALGVALAVSLPTVARSQQAADSGAHQTAAASPASILQARRLLKAMHADDNLIAAIEVNVALQRKANSQLAPVFYDSVVARMKRSAHEIVDSIAPLYARGVPGQQLETMIQFYESPAGQTLAHQQSLLSTEVAGIGQRWGVRLASDVAKDLVNAGVDIQAH